MPNTNPKPMTDPQRDHDHENHDERRRCFGRPGQATQADRLTGPAPGYRVTPAYNGWWWAYCGPVLMAGNWPTEVAAASATWHDHHERRIAELMASLASEANMHGKACAQRDMLARSLLEAGLADTDGPVMDRVSALGCLRSRGWPDATEADVDRICAGLNTPWDRPPSDGGETGS